MALAVILLVACDGGPDAATPVVLGSAGPDRDAVPVDPALCAGLDECACSQTPGCAPLTSDCWCPPASCGAPAIACTCEGGRYLGCNAVSTRCPAGEHCSLMGQAAAPDENGCLKCVDPTDCAGAIAGLAASCPTLPESETQWICSDALQTCATFCLTSLRTCESASCALCLDCSCGNDLFDSCIAECATSSQSRH
jgi:hypothetical protein